MRASNQVSSGKGNIKNMSLSFHFLFFFLTTFKTNDKKRDWIPLFIRNKNDHQMQSGGRWRCIEEKELDECGLLFYSDKETVSVCKKTHDRLEGKRVRVSS